MVDVGEMSFIDSSGLNALVHAYALHRGWRATSEFATRPRCFSGCSRSPSSKRCSSSTTTVIRPAHPRIQPRDPYGAVAAVQDIVLVSTDDDRGAGLRAALAERPELVVLAEVAGPHEAVAFARRYQPGVVVLDVGIEAIAGHAVLKSIREVAPATRIVLHAWDAEVSEAPGRRRWVLPPGQHGPRSRSGGGARGAAGPAARAAGGAGCAIVHL